METYRVKRRISNGASVGAFNSMAAAQEHRNAMAVEDRVWYETLQKWVRKHSLQRHIILSPEMRGDIPVFGLGRILAECTPEGHKRLRQHPSVEKLIETDAPEGVFVKGGKELRDLRRAAAKAELKKGPAR